jgi:hypothetical protein
VGQRSKRHFVTRSRPEQLQHEWRVIERSAEFADIVCDIDHGCLTYYDDVGFTPQSSRQCNANLTDMLAAPA